MPSDFFGGFSQETLEALGLEPKIPLREALQVCRDFLDRIGYCLCCHQSVTDGFLDEFGHPASNPLEIGVDTLLAGRLMIECRVRCRLCNAKGTLIAESPQWGEYRELRMEAGWFHKKGEPTKFMEWWTKKGAHCG